jgi:hypothetical protein
MLSSASMIWCGLQKIIREWTEDGPQGPHNVITIARMTRPPGEAGPENTLFFSEFGK